jgi:hypothetical protein
MPDPKDHAPRFTVGRAVYRRETWVADASGIPWARPGHGTRSSDARSWAQGLGMPRRVFVSSPAEDKPLFVDFDSAALVGMLARVVRRTLASPADTRAGTSIRFTEMLPGPGGCWLEDAAGRRYTSELRLVAVDLTRWPATRRYEPGEHDPSRKR